MTALLHLRQASWLIVIAVTCVGCDAPSSPLSLDSIREDLTKADDAYKAENYRESVEYYRRALDELTRLVQREKESHQPNATFIEDCSQLKAAAETKMKIAEAALELESLSSSDEHSTLCVWCGSSNVSLQHLHANLNW